MTPSQIIDTFLPAARAAYQPSGAAPLPAGFIEAGRISTATGGQDFGFVAFNASIATALIAIRGTEDIEDWLRDVDAVPVPIGGGSFVHRGFHGAYAAIRLSIISWLNALELKTLWITGHSMGGAMAAACAWDLVRYPGSPLEVITFAAPRFGDGKFAEAFNRQVPDCVRVTNSGDLVPLVPTHPPYEHVGADLAVDGGFRMFDPKFAHSLDQYEAGLRKLAR